MFVNKKLCFLFTLCVLVVFVNCKRKYSSARDVPHLIRRMKFYGFKTFPTYIPPEDVSWPNLYSLSSRRNKFNDDIIKDSLEDIVNSFKRIIYHVLDLQVNRVRGSHGRLFKLACVSLLHRFIKQVLLLLSLNKAEKDDNHSITSNNDREQLHSMNVPNKPVEVLETYATTTSTMSTKQSSKVEHEETTTVARNLAAEIYRKQPVTTAAPTITSKIPQFSETTEKVPVKSLMQSLAYLDQDEIEEHDEPLLTLVDLLNKSHDEPIVKNVKQSV